MISQETFDRLQKLGEEIKRDESVRAQRSIDICWHWWHVGRVLCSDPEKLYGGKHENKIPSETMTRICEALGLSTKITPHGPGGKGTVLKAIEVYNKWADEDSAKEAIEKAGTYNRLLMGTKYETHPPHAVNVPVSLMAYIEIKTGVGDKEARKYIARYLNIEEIQQDIVTFIQQS